VLRKSAWKNRHSAPAVAGVPEIKFFETHAAGAMLGVINLLLPESCGANMLDWRCFFPGRESRFINGAHDWRVCGISAA